MIQLSDKIWIGSPHDEVLKDLGALKVEAVLNVAHDLQCPCKWIAEVEYMQVGLVDGPGNIPAIYHAAVLAMHALMKKYERVLLCCHDGGRSLAVALMYLHLTSGRGWCWWWGRLTADIVKVEGADVKLPEVHEAHKMAFDRMNWRLLLSVLGD